MPGIGGVTISPLINLGARRSGGDPSITFTTNASTDAQNQSWTVRFPVGKSITVDWGDGNTDTINGNGTTSVNFTHTYATVAARTINIKGDYVLLTYINSGSNGLLTTSISGLVNLTYLYLANNSLTDIGNLSSLVNLTFLSLSTNSLTDIGDLSGLVNLTSLYLYNNSLTDIGDLSSLVNLTYLNLATNSLTD
ncbi:MAG TPA: leucine-rich repeat domain-containing protein, partial [Ignavibacteriaceae bacterium]|nr:leucine-rich repeat domain-containing protein [Ignavibacteriaceae bacterium]